MPDEKNGNSAGHVERADPARSLRSSIEDGRLLRDSLTRSFLIALGAPTELLDRMVVLSDELGLLVTGYERWAALTSIGWAISDLANPRIYDRATEMLEAGDQEASEEELEEYWNEAGKLESAVLRVLRVATHSEIRIKVGRRRLELLELAVVDHRSGRFHASVPVVLAQAEGMVRDVIGSSPYQQASRLTDDVSRGGHPDILQPIFKASGETMNRTVLEDAGLFPTRHGILHGRTLGYDTRRNSTKALVAIAELATFCQARILEAVEGGTLDELDHQAFGSA
jgi:hypothetical protein